MSNTNKINSQFIEEMGEELIDEVRSSHPLGNLLVDARLEATGSLTSCAGRAYVDKRLIEISDVIFARNQNEAALKNTILHEIAHLLTPNQGHNEVWKVTAQQIGCDGEQYHEMKTGRGLGAKLSTTTVTQTNVPSGDGGEVKDVFGDFVLEPLSKATKTKFKKLDFKERDYCLVWLNKKRDRFIVELQALKPIHHEPNSSMHQEVDVEVKLEKIGSEDWENMKPSWNSSMLFNRIPEKTWLGKHSWEKKYRYTCAVTDFTALVIHASVPKDKLLFRARHDLPEATEAKLMFESLLKRFAAQGIRSGKLSDWKLNGNSQEMPKSWREHKELPLADYQKQACLFGYKHEGTALFMDRGTGKTATVIQRICQDALDQSAMLRVLVVCPNQVRLNWENEIQRFSVCPGKVTVMRGGQVKRVKSLIQAVKTEADCKFSVLVAGYDSVVNTCDEIEKVPWDLVICDESHFFKSPKTHRWGALKRIRDISKNRMILTGTPVGNSPMDLWSQLEFLGDGCSGFQDYKTFKSFHGKWVKGSASDGRQGIEKLVGLKNIPLLQERLTRLSVQISKAEAGLNLPDKVYEIREVEMTKKQADIYKKIATELAIEIENKLTGDVNQMVIQNILTQLLRLAQITSGHIVWDEVRDPEGEEILSPRKVEQIDKQNPKVEAVLDMLKEEEDKNSKFIIWCSFVPDIKILSQVLELNEVRHECYYGGTPQSKRDNIVESFNKDPELRVLVCNPQTAGEGLNLLGYDYENPDNSSTYTGHEIFFSQNWSAILRGQAEDRAHRRGTRMPVTITDLQVPGTIDEEIRERVNSKREMSTTVLDVTEILQSLKGER